MGGRTIQLGADERPLEGGWELLVTEGGRYQRPSDIPRSAIRLAALVPGTVAGALSASGLYDVEKPENLLEKDAWYFRSLGGEAPGPATLRFEGLATVAEIYLNGELVLTSTSMFECHELAIRLTDRDELVLCFRALAPHPERRGPRARWRPQLFDSQGLRSVRTTLLGHMPGWCPSVHAVGPWRPISLVRSGHNVVSNLRLTAILTDDCDGHLSASFQLATAASSIRLTCNGHSSVLSSNDGTHFSGCLVIPDIEPWWPHTHGRPALYDVQLTIDGQTHGLGLVGFRTVAVEHGSDGRDFRLVVNGERIFCRGAVWTTADLLNLSGSAETYAPWLMQAAEAGMNMIRIGGTMTYESADFFRLCDRLGILVWQDFMFANFDYPVGEEGFADQIRREIETLLLPIQGSPSLAVLCGGSEVYQQAAMLGLPEPTWRGAFFTETLAFAASDFRPDVVYVENSPSGGAMPFSPNHGVTHYYGVGAYCRPLEDARRAEVRFAAECLALSQVPQQATLDEHLAVPAVHDPLWKSRIPRDRNASWDFEDVRDHYLQLLYGFDPTRLRREDQARYLDLSRAVTAEVVTETFAEWRRPGSSCNGALIWTYQDILPGAGWGIIDSTGEPKPVWYALKRAFRPLQLVVSDEGTNGLYVHALNESSRTMNVIIRLTCLRDGRQKVVSGESSTALAPRSTYSIAATDMFGAFFDTTYAFRFGPVPHHVTVATMHDAETGEMLSEAFHFPQGRGTAFFDPEISISLRKDDVWTMTIEADRFAQSVNVNAHGFSVSDDWFHMGPGKRTIRLTPRPGTSSDLLPTGTFTTLGSRRVWRF
ncbi:glycoside hydrolase family 2 protein [Ciceribacter sp. L1K22]|uniref:glycosyl hydrolase 2 galactose-binding domain-containing protein n=1 Tax=Ciceribacter sp. L1K22 TaxID=2820275 RepID=UPI001ABEA1EF|nr:glycoside hydrolase family 2 protein [Ciceribacter sp. L1K22]MBO3758132.1 glycoside hydrolase family 2 protein [Ciceribacter sp. L1K22]